MQKHQPLEIDVHHAVPVVAAGFGDRSWIAVDPRAVEGRVDPPVARDRGFDCVFDRGFVADIAGDKGAIAEFSEFGLGLPPELYVTVDEGHTVSA
jgi:hypothetical protein